MSIINPTFGQPKPPAAVEFKALLATNMDNLLLHRLPEGFISRLSDDTIVVDFKGGNTARLFGEFNYSKPTDLPTDGPFERYQETLGGAVQFEAKNLKVTILDGLGMAGDETDQLLELMFQGDDKFTGSDFADLLRAFGGNDTLDGGAGNDYLRGGDGNDSVAGGSGVDDLHGNLGNDTVRGGDGDDWVCGGQDNDRLLGDAGNDLVLGNLGSDSLLGGAGNDVVRGGQGDDVIEGGDGDDWISGDKGFDVLYGGRGADTFHFFTGAGLDRVHDFSATEGDRVQLQLGTLYTVEQFGADVLVRVGSVDQLVLVNVQLSSLPSGWIFAV